jgi:sugar phosphate isomerase/epimerase
LRRVRRDIGHWTALSGLVSAESLRKLDGRVIEFHFKDIDENKDDVGVDDRQGRRPRGHGRNEAAELQNKPLLSIEYETGRRPGAHRHNGAQSVEKFNEIASRAGQTTVEKRFRADP